MYYSYDPDEIESASRLGIEYLTEGWYLGTSKSRDGSFYACLMSTEEKEAFEQIVFGRTIGKAMEFG